MTQFTEGQKRIFLGVAIVEAVIALVLIGLSLANVTRLPVFIPLLLLVSAAGLFVATRRR